MVNQNLKFDFPYNTARYWQNHFRAGMILIGVEDSIPEWLGTDNDWRKLKELDREN
ncbi:MAG: hypothetical protein VKN72_04830 [Nostocales cyanobacterium 94392]|nr:hypothetical protein [Nostocales cyanobacterium 94392]